MKKLLLLMPLLIACRTVLVLHFKDIVAMVLMFIGIAAMIWAYIDDKLKHRK